MATASQGITTATASVAQARETLRVALVGVQEAALSNENQTVSGHLLHAAELVADATSLLFELEQTPEDAPNRGNDVARAREVLHDALEVLQVPEVFAAISAGHVESVANALAVVYVVSRAEQRRATERAEGRTSSPARSAGVRPSKRKGLVLVPEADSTPPGDSKRVAEPHAAKESEKAATAEVRARRASERAVLEVDVGYVSESNFYAGLSMDVSAGGLFVATYKLVPVGTAVTLTFMLPGGQTVTTAGEVRWVREPGAQEDAMPGMGVAFESLTDADLKAITQFARQRTPIYHDSDDD